jgi:ankyrin repeat protein
MTFRVTIDSDEDNYYYQECINAKKKELIEYIKLGKINKKFGKYDDSLLHLAVYYGFEDLCQQLINKKVDFEVKNSLGKKPIEYANSEITEMLVKAQCSLEGISIGINEVDMFIKLGKHDVILQKSKNTLLFYCDGYEDRIKKLINLGVDVNYRNIHGSTAIHFLRNVDPLIEAKADVNNINNEGISVLMDQVWHGQPDIVQKLILAGADKTYKNKELIEKVPRFVMGAYGWGSNTQKVKEILSVC